MTQKRDSSGHFVKTATDEKSWRERLTPSEMATIERAQRRVTLAHLGAGSEYLISKLATLLDEKEGLIDG